MTERAPGPWRLYVLSGALFALAAALLLAVNGDAEPFADAPVDVPWWLVALGFVFVELVAVHLESRGEAHAITFSEIPFAAGLLLAAPEALLIGRLVAGVLVLGVIRRQSLHKLSLNLGLFAANTMVAVAVFRWLLGTGEPEVPTGWLAVFGALLVAQVLDTVVVTGAVTLYSGWPGRHVVQQVVVYGFLSSVANTSLGIALVVSLWDGSYIGLLIVGVVAILFLVYRSHLKLAERHSDLETLHDFTRRLGGSLELDELEREVLLGARSILRGERAALVLPPVRAGAPATRLVATDDEVQRREIGLDELAADLALLLPRGEARLFEPGQPLPGWLGELGVKDAAIVPIGADGPAAGVLLVANRLTDVSSFVEEDLRVFATLASHAGVALENGRLVAHLQHEAAEKAYEALHDAVTGLPNRQALTRDLTDAIRRARADGARVGLILVDLDTFKEVNDTLGRLTADRLLIEVRQRLADLVPAGATLARSTGDQFAVLVAGAPDAGAVVELAETVHAAFDAPFTSDSLSLVLGASIGVALYPDHARAADVLFQRADAATYVARAEGSGIEVYAAENDPYAPRRLALAADLREALDTGTVDVYVQPKVAMADGVVQGAEALVRWNHPRLGPVSPAQFIPAAEHTGVIRALTLYVVREALAQCASWRRSGHDLGIAVNLSARNLFDLHLADDITGLVQESGLAPEALTLELTESTVMGESQRTLAVLDQLAERGIRLSVDDFGTGYSSLSHLRNLPVSELKIDRSFIATMTLNDHDAVIVRSLIELGRNLGLRTVAEGVESREAWDMLRGFGCDQAQGFLLSRPLPAERFVAWLERQSVARIDEGVVPFPAVTRRLGHTKGHG
ncbi:MAG: putative bifunctional diguanylate cyclase/phosphodiesterase [Acidimicrobiia bacterium]